MFHKYIIPGLITLMIIITSCIHKKQYISGIYSHHHGIQNYYMLSLTKSSKNEYKISLEGVPLEKQSSGLPWNTECVGKLKEKKIVCKNFSLFFSVDYQTIKVKYNTKEEQVFISTKKEFEEEVESYE